MLNENKKELGKENGEGKARRVPMRMDNTHCDQMCRLHSINILTWREFEKT